MHCVYVLCTSLVVFENGEDSAEVSSIKSQYYWQMFYGLVDKGKTPSSGAL